MGSSLSEHLKNETVKMSDGVDVRNTKILDGEASDMPFLNESNETKQYKTGTIPKDDLGGRNNLNG